MIRVASFPVEKFAEANAFMEKNPPLQNDQGSGLGVNNGYFIIKYDDGVLNPNEFTSYIRTRIREEQHKLYIIRHSNEESAIALADVEKDIDERVPAGYKIELSDNQARKVFSSDGLVGYVGAEELRSIRDKFNSTLAKKINLENTMLTNEHEMTRIEYSIKSISQAFKR